MKQTKFEVKLPKEDVIDEQVSIIVAKALPKQKSMLGMLIDLWHSRHLWQVFFGRGEWLFSLILLVGVLVLTVLSVENNSIKASEFYSFTIIAAPFLFLALTCFSYIDKKRHGTLELVMTMKFTLYQMLAIRMFVYSIIASFFIITSILVAALFVEIKVLYSIPIGLSGLFIFAALLLLLYQERHLLVRTGVFCFIWIGGNLSLSYLLKDSYEFVLTKLPIFIYFLILIAAFSLFIFSLKRFFTRNQGGAFECLS